MVNSLVESKHLHRIILKLLKPNMKASTPMMTQPAVRDYINAIAPKYQASLKPEKTKLLDASVLATDLNRKHLIKQLNCVKKDKPLSNKRSGRPKKYDHEALKPHVLYLWRQMNCICAKRMKEGLKDWLRHYKKIPAHLKMQLLSMSSATLARYLMVYRKEDEVTHGLSTTKQTKASKGFMHSVPIANLDSKVTRVGHTQMDTVSHCGASALGPFISSLTITDILTTWTANRAMLGKTGKNVVANLKDIELNSLPFIILNNNGDSGSEFINKAVANYARSRWELTRSRPYKKNDNYFVEQKNFTHVRQLFGYERLDTEELVDLMNDIYINYWNPLQNYFLPTIKLKEKVRVGSKIKKIFDTAKTPYQRLLDAPDVQPQVKTELIKVKSKLSPFKLKEGLNLKLKEFNNKLRQLNYKDAA